ncbi:pyruvate kinase [Flavobacteriaceae bacterium]|nr:pyruvate kinase [Flavobacteriaceae bacterium]MDB0043247.1 pyruvate kinase [Flavobacteriaceae bacterium]MDB4239344.1 pyruvate kinase [Flavobacteriaceae bacterium]MDB9787732.1 pyruvate kinase [Flavobacteriaceae bacterium]MDB9902120.1 pyruvate kinase [Flavobacteriaceae bacterium]
MTFNKTKIIATLGPSSTEKSMLKALVKEGVNVFRVNFSHANHNEVKQTVLNIREISSALNIHVAILGDLQGPKIRLGIVKDDVYIENGETISITTDEIEFGNSSLVSINYKDFPKDVSKGEKILIDDGKLILKVLETNKKNLVKAEIIQGGELKSRKGVNLPNTKLSLPALTEKDKADAVFALENNFDWLALSFVRSKKDVYELEELINKNSKDKIPIIAKIEKPEAILNLDAILHAADGLMVARGDLGLEIPAEEVPLKQKLMVNMAKKARKPIIIATQMMESMIDSLTPSRAEVNDVANSVMDGADAVMLSGETSVGQYPVEVIQTVGKIIKGVENSPLIQVPNTLPEIHSKRVITKAVCFQACNIANELEASAICTLTNSGYTAWQISSWRPSAVILVFTSNKRILSQLCLLWGVRCVFYDNFVSTDKTVEEVNALAVKKGFVKKGDLVINLAAMPVVEKGQVNTLRISRL